MFWGISNTLKEAFFGKRVAILKFIYFFKMPISMAKLHGQVIFSHLWNNHNKMEYFAAIHFCVEDF
jgi:hypothetical protein